MYSAPLIPIPLKSSAIVLKIWCPRMCKKNLAEFRIMKSKKQNTACQECLRGLFNQSSKNRDLLLIRELAKRLM